MYFYTIHEGGRIFLLPVKSRHSVIVKQLRKNRNNTGLYKGYIWRTHIRVPGQTRPFLVHSVFFVKKRKVSKVWDVRFNGYRPDKMYHNFQIPEAIYQQIVSGDYMGNPHDKYQAIKSGTIDLRHII